MPGRLLQWRGDGAWLEAQLAGCLVRHEHRDLIDELLEVLGLGLLVAQDRQLVLNKRMPDNSQRGEFFYALDHPDPRFQHRHSGRSPAHNLIQMKEYQAVVV